MMMVVVVVKAGTITSCLVFKNLSYLISLIVTMVRHRLLSVLFFGIDLSYTVRYS